MYQGQFDKQLNYIQNDKYRELTRSLLNEVPEYFWSVPASSTGKYHPSYALGDEGLVRHTIAAVELANCILNETDTLDSSQDDIDIVISALLLHDTFKHGNKSNKYTVHEHPLIAADFIRNYADKHDDEIVNYFCHSVASLVESHMGKWTTSNRSKYILPKPETLFQKIVHWCDYLASRKFIEIYFNI